MQVKIRDIIFDIREEEIKYKDFLILKNYNFNKNKILDYDMEPEIFEKIIIK